jgi:hypothetical protein
MKTAINAGLIVLFVFLLGCQPNEEKATQQRDKQESTRINREIADLTLKHNADSDWPSRLKDAPFTVDVDPIFVRADHRPMFFYASLEDVRRIGDSVFLFFLTMPTQREPSLRLILECGGCDLPGLKKSANTFGDFGLIAQIFTATKSLDESDEAPEYLLHGRFIEAIFVGDYALSKALDTPLENSQPKALAEHSAAGSTENAASKYPSEWWMVGLTSLIVIVAAIQASFFWHQLRLIEKGMVDSTKAADAATRSAEVAADSERAWIITKVEFSSGLPDIAGQGGPVTSAMVVSLENAGRSPAEIKIARVVTALVSSDDELPEQPFYGDPNEMYEVSAMGGEIIPAREKIQMFCPIQNIPLLTQSQKLEIKRGLKTLYCYGKVIYKDLSGRVRTTQFGYSFYVRAGASDSRPEAMYRLGSRQYNFTD